MGPRHCRVGAVLPLPSLCVCLSQKDPSRAHPHPKCPCPPGAKGSFRSRGSMSSVVSPFGRDRAAELPCPVSPASVPWGGGQRWAVGSELRPLCPGAAVRVKKLCELQPGEKCCVVGTLFKAMPLQPSILREVSEEVRAQPAGASFRICPWGHRRATCLRPRIRGWAPAHGGAAPRGLSLRWHRVLEGSGSKTASHPFVPAQPASPASPEQVHPPR